MCMYNNFCHPVSFPRNWVYLCPRANRTFAVAVVQDRLPTSLRRKQTKKTSNKSMGGEI